MVGWKGGGVMRIVKLFFVSILCGVLLASVFLAGGVWYYQAYPAQHLSFFAALVLAGGLLFGCTFFARLRRAEWLASENGRSCSICGQSGTFLAWCSYHTGHEKCYGYLCRDCQNQYRAIAEA